MEIEVHKTAENAADAIFSLLELKDQIVQITLDQISDGVRIDVKIYSLAKKNGEYEECKKCPLGGPGMRPSQELKCMSCKNELDKKYGKKS